MRIQRASVLLVLVAIACESETPQVLVVDCPEDSLEAPPQPRDGGIEDLERPLDGSISASDALSSPDDVVEPTACPPGLAGCIDGQLLRCTDDGLRFELTACEPWQVCWEGACVECADDTHCPAGAVCQDSTCVVLPLEILTTELPVAPQGLPYSAPLQAQGGVPPYGWSIHQGSLPDGIELSNDGVLSGMSDDIGPSPLLIRVSDTTAASVIAPITLEVVDNGLYIGSPATLPLAKGGDTYSYQLEALGGTPPYFWGLADGALPPGLSLRSDGVLEGVLESSGAFTFSAKVFDNGSPPSVADKIFTLPVSVAPLDVTGGTELDVLVAQLIVLPLILIIPDFPVPYNAALEATGGQAPLTWSEEPLADGLAGLIPNSGLPEGLSLDAAGNLTGTLSDPSQAVAWNVPVLNITLYGFFFSASVTDAQVIPYEDSAFYLIPTVPLDF